MTGIYFLARSGLELKSSHSPIRLFPPQSNILRGRRITSLALEKEKLPLAPKTLLFFFFFPGRAWLPLAAEHSSGTAKPGCSLMLQRGGPTSGHLSLPPPPVGIWVCIHCRGYYSVGIQHMHFVNCKPHTHTHTHTYTLHLNKACQKGPHPPFLPSKGTNSSGLGRKSPSLGHSFPLIQPAYFWLWDFRELLSSALGPCNL